MRWVFYQVNKENMLIYRVDAWVWDAAMFLPLLFLLIYVWTKCLSSSEWKVNSLCNFFELNRLSTNDFILLLKVTWIFNVILSRVSFLSFLHPAHVLSSQSLPPQQLFLCGIPLCTSCWKQLYTYSIHE